MEGQILDMNHRSSSDCRRRVMIQLHDFN